MLCPPFPLKMLLLPASCTVREAYESLAPVRQLTLMEKKPCLSVGSSVTVLTHGLPSHLPQPYILCEGSHTET